MTREEFDNLTKGKIGAKTRDAMWETRPTRDNPTEGFAEKYSDTSDSDITEEDVKCMIKFSLVYGLSHVFDN